MNDEINGVVGYCDGVKGGEAYGWAWRPGFPDMPVPIELWADGALIGETMATLYRPDLRAAGIGHGKYGWRIPLAMDPARGAPCQMVARVKDGEPLVRGSFEYSAKPPVEDVENSEFQAFVAAALGQKPVDPTPRAEPFDTPVNFLLHSPALAHPSRMGEAEYSYTFVMKAFKPLLERLGRVQVIADPAREADRLHAEHIARGETSLLLSFAPPHRTVMGLRCPTIPVVAWEYPTVPDRVWDEDRRHDWRFVLRQTGRVIVLSRLAADAVRASMGADFPVLVLPTPVWDRFPELQTAGRPVAGAQIAIDGFFFDSRDHVRTSQASPPLPPPRGDGAPPSTATLDGVVFTSVFSPKDGRKNWLDMLGAFVAAHGGVTNATLVLKMIGNDPGLWWWELHDALAKLPPFDCRVLVAHGYMDEGQYNGLIAASHWAVNASRAEGLCLPLVEFMSAGRPALSPIHTAMADYLSPANAVVVDSDEEYCNWPHDPDKTFTTIRHRVSWPGLVAAFAQAHRLTLQDPDRYDALSADARRTMARFCSDEVIAARLDSFLGLGLGLAQAPPVPSLVLAEAAA